MPGPTLDELYLMELETQCEYARIAVMDMEDFLTAKRREDRRFWYSLQAFLISVANISKMLWPAKAENDDRGRRLRTILSIHDDSPLKPRTFRNHFEHYDERISEWFYSDRPPGFADFCIGGDDSFGGGLNKPHYMRNFNPQTLSLYFRGEEYELKPVVEALGELRQRVERVLNPPLRESEA